MVDEVKKFFSQIFNLSSRSILFWVIVVVTSIGFYFLFEVNHNDWELNTADLPNGLVAYDNPAYVYPPWALILLWPYRWMTARGSRIASVLVAGWLVHHRRWSLKEFLLIVLNSYFIFTLLLSNVDVLVLILPIILWEAAKGTRFQTIGWGLGMALLLVKPHVGGLILLYWLWQERQNWRQLIGPLAIVSVLTIPISLMGHPPLIFQWIENLLNPSNSNQDYWGFNNISLASDIGFLPALIVMIGVLGGMLILTMKYNHTLTRDQTISTLFLGALMVSPYSSHQSVVAAVMLIPSFWGIVLAYTIPLVTTLSGVYRSYDPWWTLLIGVLMIGLYQKGSLSDA